MIDSGGESLLLFGIAQLVEAVQVQLIHNYIENIYNLCTLSQIKLMKMESHNFNESPYYKKMQDMSKIAAYKANLSMPEPPLGLDYRPTKNRYGNISKEQHKKPARKVNKSLQMQHHAQRQKIKLKTILQTQSPNAFFPKISNNVDHDQKLSMKMPRRNLYKSLLYSQHNNTETTREKSLTLQSHISIDQHKNLALNECLDINKLNHDERPSSTFQPYQQSLDYLRQSKDSSYYKKPHYHYNNHSQVNAVIQNAQEEESEDQQFIKDSSPGPGSYSYSYSDFDKCSLGKRSTKASFLSGSTRFPSISQDNKLTMVPQEIPQNPLKIQLQHRRETKIKKRYKKILVPFNAKCPRQFSYDNNSNSKEVTPGPNDYSPRSGIQQQLILKIQRNFKGSFGYIKRFEPEQTIQSHLGPGCYNESRLTDLTEGNQNYYFKSSQARFKPS